MPPETDNHRELRSDLIDATAEILRNEGIGGVSLRKIADACDTSTQSIYTIFGSKSGLFQALWEEGFEELARHLEQVDDLPPPERLRALGEGYRDFALSNPEFYEAMFARKLEEYRPESADVERETRAFQILYDCVVECTEQGAFGNLEPRAVADALWTAVHGFSELELSGFYQHDARADRQFGLVLDAIGTGLRTVGVGEDPARDSEG